MVLQVVQSVGALLILVAFVLVQRGKMGTDTRWYLWLNSLGSLVLMIVAVLEVQIGFIVLELVWAAVSAIGLWRSYRSAPP